MVFGRDPRELENDGPIVKLVNTLVTRAVNERASDIHVEPGEHELRIRFRIDGVLHEYSTVKNMRDHLKASYQPFFRGDQWCDDYPAETWAEEKELRRGDRPSWTDEQQDAAVRELARKLRADYGHQMDTADGTALFLLVLGYARAVINDVDHDASVLTTCSYFDCGFVGGTVPLWRGFRAM